MPQPRGRTILKANNDYDTAADIETDEVSDEEGYDVQPQAAFRNSSMQKMIGDIARGQRDLALAMTTVVKSLTSSQLNRHGPMGSVGDQEDELPLPPPGLGGGGRGAAPGGLPDELDMGEQMSDRQQDDKEEDLNLGGGRGGYGPLGGAPGRAKLSKDDSSSNFGEIDDDEPGNRPFNPANTNESDTVITGKPGTGPGPLSGSLRKAIVSDVLAALQSGGILPNTQISKSTSTPEPGAPSAADYTSSALNKAVADTTDLVKQYAELSWHDLNRARTQMVPGSLLPFPIYGQPAAGDAGALPSQMQFR